MLKDKKREIYFIIIITTVIALIPVLQNNVYYSEPDDYLMNLINQGEFGNGTDAHIVFVNLLTGLMIKILYGVYPFINWYAAVYLCTVVLASAVLMYVCMRETTGRFLIPVLGLVEYFLIYHLTFTILGYFCIACAFIYLFAVIGQRDYTYRARLISDILLVCFLFGLGICYRKGVLISSLILTVPFVLYYWRRTKNRNYIFITAIIFFVQVLSCNYIMDAGYSSELWNEFSDYNRLRSAVLDNTQILYEENREELEKNDLSENDLRCLYRWIIADKKKFSEDKMENLISMNSSESMRNSNILSLLDNMFRLPYNYWFLFFVLAAGFFCAKRERCYIAFAAFITYFLIMALFYRNRPVLRVMIPLYLSGGLYVLFVSLHNNNFVHIEKKWKVICHIFLSGMIALVLGVVILNADRTDRVYMQKRAAYREVYDYISDNQKILYAGSSATINEFAYCETIFDIGKEIDISNVIKLGSWDIYSSRYYHQIKSYDIQPQDRLIIALAESDNVQYMVNSLNTEEIEILQRYIEENSHKKVKMSLVKEFAEANISVYDIGYLSE